MTLKNNSDLSNMLPFTNNMILFLIISDKPKDWFNIYMYIIRFSILIVEAKYGKILSLSVYAYFLSSNFTDFFHRCVTKNWKNLSSAEFVFEKALHARRNLLMHSAMNNFCYLLISIFSYVIIWSRSSKKS